ncbi:hypothetical protein JKP88DRAFT_288352 [Tribonema minus]|uniref:Uncharacterized protein n=1 Tax=Tribonema minus TaxID=303371 RepID=A0A836CHS9_9STRA|nr:hypothetical protein JKP88DRAFT_288352 [Tribonema minus]
MQSAPAVFGLRGVERDPAWCTRTEGRLGVQFQPPGQCPHCALRPAPPLRITARSSIDGPMRAGRRVAWLSEATSLTAVVCLQGPWWDRRRAAIAPHPSPLER